LCRLREKWDNKTHDAIIAATALANDFILITTNEKDFVHIKGLKLINSYKSGTRTSNEFSSRFLSK